MCVKSRITSNPPLLPNTIHRLSQIEFSTDRFILVKIAERTHICFTCDTFGAFSIILNYWVLFLLNSFLLFVCAFNFFVPHYKQQINFNESLFRMRLYEIQFFLIKSHTPIQCMLIMTICRLFPNHRPNKIATKNFFHSNGGIYSSQCKNQFKK